MRSRAMIFLITLMINGCASKPATQVVQVLIPEKTYSGTVKRSDILQCPRPVQESTYFHLRKRDQYIETLVDVIKAHNEVIAK